MWDGCVSHFFQYCPICDDDSLQIG
eukprot:COSAG06_NODE_39107_length_416_cov_0.943218_2_plen_24_part_01